MVHADLHLNDHIRVFGQLKSGLESGRTGGRAHQGKPSPWDYNFEFVYQWGNFGRGAVSAWTAASDTGYTIRTRRFRPQLSVKANAANLLVEPKREAL
jgi:hypothetical protein